MPRTSRRLRLLAPIVATGVIISVGAAEAVVAQAEPLANPSGEAVTETATLTVSTAAEPPLGPGETITVTIEDAGVGVLESTSLEGGDAWTLPDLPPAEYELTCADLPSGYEVGRTRCVTNDTVVRDVAGPFVLLSLPLAVGDALDRRAAQRLWTSVGRLDEPTDECSEG